MLTNVLFGEINNDKKGFKQCISDKIHFIIYGTGTRVNIESRDESKLQTYVQTIEMGGRVECVCINLSNMMIAVSFDNMISLFVMEEQNGKKIWKAKKEFKHWDESIVTCIDWNCVEDILVVGSLKSLSIYKCQMVEGEIDIKHHWHSIELNSIHDLEVSSTGKNILTKSVDFSKILKLWTLKPSAHNEVVFEVNYINHFRDCYVLDFFFRKSQSESEFFSNNQDNFKIKSIDQSIYLKNENCKNEIFYTFTNDSVLTLWIIYEFKNHFYIKSWANSNLKLENENKKIITVLYLENSLKKKMNLCKNVMNEKIKMGLDEDFDIILVFCIPMNLCVFLVTRICASFPNNIKIEKLNNFETNCLFYKNYSKDQYQDLIKKFITRKSSDKLEKINLVNKKNFIFFSKVCFVLNESNVHKLSILVNNSFEKILYHLVFDLNFISLNGNLNIQKFDFKKEKKITGHSFNVNKILVPVSKNGNESLFLTILDTPKELYVWNFKPYKHSTMNDIKKKYKLVCSNKSNFNEKILDTILIPTYRNNKSFVFILILYYNFNIDLWICDLSKDFFQIQKSIESFNLFEEFKSSIPQTLNSFFYIKIKSHNNDYTETDNDEFLIFALFENGNLKSWNFKCYLDQNDNEKIYFQKINISYPFQISDIHKLIFFKDTVKLFSYIDVNGLVKIYSVKLHNDMKITFNKIYELKTYIKECKMVKGSFFTKKLFITDNMGLNLVVWNFELGLVEFNKTCDLSLKKITFLDFNYINENKNIILMIGFDSVFLIYVQSLCTFIEDSSSFKYIKELKLSNIDTFFDNEISFLNNSNFLVSFKNQIHLYNALFDIDIKNYFNKSNYEFLTNESQIVQIQNKSKNNEIKKTIQLNNNHLPLYHPVFLIHCLFMNKIDFVKFILVNLYSKCNEKQKIFWDLGLDVFNQIIMKKTLFFYNENLKDHLSTYFKTFVDEYLINSNIQMNDVLDYFKNNFSKNPQPFFFSNDMNIFFCVLSIVKIHEKFHYIFNENDFKFIINIELSMVNTKKKILSFSDIIWAIHSENKLGLIEFIKNHYCSLLDWNNIKRFRIIYWIDESCLINLIEDCSKIEFSKEKTISGLFSLFYIALNKKNILLSLWKNINHQEKDKIIKFLLNDFSDERWKTAAKKNAFVLTSKHRYLDAAYFFLLADSIDDCCFVLANKANDITLSILILKIFSMNNPNAVQRTKIFSKLIDRFFLPEIIETGNNYMLSWIFTELNQKKLAYESLYKPINKLVMTYVKNYSYSFDMKNLITMLNLKSFFLSNKNPNILFLISYLNQKNENFSNISQEFKCVLDAAAMYGISKCQYLSLILIKNWKFNKNKT